MWGGSTESAGADISTPSEEGEAFQPWCPPITHTVHTGRQVEILLAEKAEGPTTTRRGVCAYKAVLPASGFSDGDRFCT
jgi:hypothetical protein